MNDAIAKNIIELMEKNNVTRTQLSKDLGLRYSTVSDWINAKSLPGLDKIILIADYFNVSISDLIEDDNSFLIKVEKDRKDDSTIRIAKYYEKLMKLNLTEDKMNDVMRYAEFLKEK